MAEVEGALASVRVLDLATGRAGSLATMLLADLGADVVRPEAVDGTHRRADPRLEPGPLCWDRGKRRTVVDRLDPRTDAELERLLAVADVIVVDGGPDALAARGLAPDVLAARHPRAVVGWAAAHGTHGALAELPEDPLLLAAISGFAQWQTSTQDAPVAPVVPFVSNVQGALAASAILAGLLERDRGGTGQVVAVTGIHAATLLLATLTGTTLDRPLAYASARDVRASASFRLYTCQDGGSFFLGALTPSIFLAALDAIDMLEVMVLPGMDGEFMNLFVADNGLRVATALEARFATQPRQHWLDVLARAGVPASAVQSREEWTGSGAFAAAAGLVTREHALLGPVTMPAPPVRLGATPAVAGAIGSPPVASTAVWAEVASSPTVAPGRSTVATAPFAGLRVLDLSTFLAGPTAPTVLGQWGADVIKVEPPSGDPYRVYNVSYAGANQGKRRVVLDLTTAPGRAALLELVAHADVVVDNFRPALRTKLGFTTEMLHTANPRVVHATVTAFGDDGPWADAPGFDPVIQACSGLMHACGDDAHPHYTSTPVHDVATGSLVLFGVLAALRARARTGRGQRVAMSLAASSLLVQCEELTTFAGRPAPARGGTAHLGAAEGHRFHRARDGWVAIVVPHAAADAVAQWCAGRPLAEAIAARTVGEVREALGAIGVAVARVVERDEQATDPHLVAHEHLHVVHDAEVGRCRVVNQVASWSRSCPVDTIDAPPREAEPPAWRPGAPWSERMLGD